MWPPLWRTSKLPEMENETRRGYDLPLTTQWWQFWTVLIAVSLMVFNMERGFRGDDSEFPRIMRCFYPLLLFMVGQEFVGFFGKLHFVPEGIAITLFGRTLRQYPRERVLQLAGFASRKKRAVSKWIAVSSLSLDELAELMHRRMPRLLRDSRTLPGWRENMARNYLCRYAESLVRQMGFPRKDLLLIEWSPERLELLLDMYPGTPWTDLTEGSVLDAQRNA